MKNTPAPAPLQWQTARFVLDLQRPLVMGIVNVTPDSFSDGGAHATSADALRHAEGLLRAGAHILDFGGESTRPGAPPVPEAEELRRLAPLLHEAVRWGVPVSVDTGKSAVMRAALELGADIINDVYALHQPGAQAVVAAHPSCGVCLMHMHGAPQTMQQAPMAGAGQAVAAQVRDFLQQASAALQARGVARARVVWDYGIGFGKSVAQNFALLAQQHVLLQAGYPLLAGWSRKSALGAVSGRARARERVVESVAAAVLAAEYGARVLRVHDVADTVAALAVWQAMRQARQNLTLS